MDIFQSIQQIVTEWIGGIAVAFTVGVVSFVAWVHRQVNSIKMTMVKQDEKLDTKIDHLEAEFRVNKVRNEERLNTVDEKLDRMENRQELFNSKFDHHADKMQDNFDKLREEINKKA